MGSVHPANTSVFYQDDRAIVLADKGSLRLLQLTIVQLLVEMIVHKSTRSIALYRHLQIDRLRQRIAHRLFFAAVYFRCLQQRKEVNYFASGFFLEVNLSIASRRCSVSRCW
jgi:hypothetical protein